MEAEKTRLLNRLKELFPFPDDLLRTAAEMNAWDPQRTLAMLLSWSNDQEEEEEPESYAEDVVEGRSVVQPQREYGSSCGYCKSKTQSSLAFGMSTDRLTPEHYQALIDRGWRRSGTWLYKPTLDKTCCPAYTIRLQVAKFHESKAQRRVRKRFDAYLRDGTVAPHAAEQRDHDPEREPAAASGRPAAASPPAAAVTGPPPAAAASADGGASDLDALADSLSLQLVRAAEAAEADGSLPSAVLAPSKPLADRASVRPSGGKHAGGVHGDLSSNFAVVLAGRYRQVALPKPVRRKGASAASAAASAPPAQADHQPSAQQQATEQGTDAPSIAKILAAKLELPPRVTASVAPNGFFNFAVADAADAADAAGPAAPAERRAQPTRPPKEKRRRSSLEASAELNALDSGPPPAHRLEIAMERSRFTQEAFELYCRYQQAVHHDKPSKLTPDQYTGFLVNSPLVFVPGPGAAVSTLNAAETFAVPDCGFGSFHMHYRLDGRLIAVGVVDVLPRCLSSVYFFYDPDLPHLSLGVYGALREIEWVKDVSKTCPQIDSYYMGFYIHTCQKMRYKADYKPSDLLDPEHFQWVPLATAVQKLAHQKYSRFIEAEPPGTSSVQQLEAVNRIPLLYNRSQIVHLQDLTAKSREQLTRRLMEYLARVGSELATQMLLSLG